jgi:hypothetical protein
MAETIKFIPATSEIEGVFDPPQPAACYLPEWYKRQPGHTNGLKSITEDGNYNHTIKHCMPVFDAMTSGYIIPLPQDIEMIDGEDGSCSAKWPSDIFKQFSTHSSAQVSELPIDTEVWEPIAWKFHNPWIIKTPPGYSCLFAQPMWHEDLPFRCFPGVVDTDTYCVQAVNFPCVFRKGFRGLLRTGTPMIQVIPFRREEWHSEVHETSTFDAKVWERSKRTFGHRYKRDYRQKKTYR